MTHTHWEAKLAAWTHDPAEKALVLMRDPAGHEWGTVANLRERIFGERAIPAHLQPIVKRADHWASAADRPQWPRDPAEGRFAAWTQVRFTESPVLIHPLSGEELELKKLPEIDVTQIKTISLDHFAKLIDPESDARKTALAFWRFGPELPAPNLGHLWGLLPADTRVPDHTIWQHLDLTAAFATAFHADPTENPALLAVSLGPVQDFIAQARTTSDLWAGSHLLSRMAWEALKVVSERLGPDSVLYPQLRGIPQVDLWLRDEMGLPREWFKKEEWTTAATDANPLFSAALPNRFVALVPAAEAESLAREIVSRTRQWVVNQASTGLELLLKRSGIPEAPSAEAQVQRQLEGFPEVHWATVPWSPLISQSDSSAAPDESGLREAIANCLPDGAGHEFLEGPVWKLLRGEVKADGQTFFTPNPGTLYPVLYDLLDRAQAAAKSVRTFVQLEQHGYRCSLCGEREWLTHDRDMLDLPPGQRTETIWSSLQGGALARKGEHLCAPCSLKRIWPTLFTEQTEAAISIAEDQKVNRFVVSTHTMALATPIARLLDRWGPEARQSLAELSRKHGIADDPPAALPAALHGRLLREADPNSAHVLKRLPNALDRLRDDEDRSPLDAALQALLGDDSRPESYYALILMDGDTMGAWLAGNKARFMPAYKDTWHPQIRNTVVDRCRNAGNLLAKLPDMKRPVSPARHMAISGALNGFALHVARHAVENIGKGKLIYAGGDDLLAMVTVDDLLEVMFLLRLAYSGVFPTQDEFVEEAWRLLGGQPRNFDLRRGHVRLNKRLLRMMGHKATASMGAVVAHHQAPLGQVLRELRSSEQRAKREGGRDAFTIDLLKRSGGAVHLTCPWLLPRPDGAADWSQLAAINLETTPMGQLIRLRNRFAGRDFSRRAAYITQGWLPDMPADLAAMETMLGHQFKRQGGGDPILGTIGKSIARVAFEAAPGAEKKFIDNFLAVAEFLAREGRVGEKARGAKEAVA